MRNVLPMFRYKNNLIISGMENHLKYSEFIESALIFAVYQIIYRII